MNYLIIILICLVLSAFFSGMEIAFVSSSRLKIEMDKKKRTFPSGIISLFTGYPARYIATMLVGNNIALVVYGIFMSVILEPYIGMFFSSEMTIMIIQTFVSTFIILIIAEFLPKALFRLNPNVILNFFTIPMLFFYILLYPVTLFIIRISHFLIRIFLKVKVNNNMDAIVFGRTDLDHLLNENKKNLQSNHEMEHELKLFQNALDFSRVKLRECLIPRTEIVAMDVNDTIENLKQKFIETGFSKLLIYENAPDEIIGYVLCLDLFKNPKSIRSKLISMPIVPETMPANKLLEYFIKERKSIALVVDEFGGTSGMVTIEDIMEEIVGEIEDEHDVDDLKEKKTGENEYLFSGRLEIDYLNETYYLGIPESDEYETIAGFILFHHGSIPKVNETIQINRFRFKILHVSDIRIELVNLLIENE